MVTSDDANPDDTKYFHSTMTDEDDATVHTTTTATKTDYIAEEMTEHTIRYEIPFSKGQANKNDYKQHVKLLRILSDAFDTTELRIIDNKNKRVKSFNEPKWMDSEYFKSHFNVHLDVNQRKTVIVHQIWAKEAIAGIKGEASVIAFLKSSNTFLRAHFWKEDDVFLKDIGFIVRYIPSHHSKAFVLRDMFQRVEFATDEGWTSTNLKAPPFQLIHSQPRIQVNKQVLKTHAYSIQT
jgi:hypothetical protein